jgi:hypothetical protein
VRGEQPLQISAHGLGEGQQPQGLGRRAAVDHDDVPGAGLRCALHRGECEQLLDTGQDRQLVRDQLVDARPGQHRGEVVAQPAPRTLEQCPGVDVRGEQAADPVDLRRLAAELGLQCVAQRVGRVRGDGQRLAAGPREMGGRRRGEGGLADPTLAREQHHPHRTRVNAARIPWWCGQAAPSTRRLRPLSAVSMITFSALRRSIPIIGMFRSTASE